MRPSHTWAMLAGVALAYAVLFAYLGLVGSTIGFGLVAVGAYTLARRWAIEGEPE